MRPSFQPRKRFGQHFLKDKSVIQALVELIHPTLTDHLIEIGPGLGALTFALLPHLRELTVIELDRDLIQGLKDKSQQKLVIYNQDALTFDFSTIAPSIRIVGNLPYNISTPLLFHFLEYAKQIDDIHIMLQKEVADRLCAKPGHKTFGRLSVMMQYHAHIELLLNIPPEAFYPAPKVMSAFIRITPYKTLPFVAHHPSFFTELIKTAFLHRRKTLRNNLHSFISENKLKTISIDLNKRPEELTVSDYVQLSNQLSND